MSLIRFGLLAAVCVALFVPAAGRANHRDDAEHEHYDTRHGHNHYYPQHGVVVHGLPQEAHAVYWHGAPYWFHGGVWYGPHAHGYVVIAPPVGVVVPVLPAFATLVVLGGIQYYYANDVYYRTAPGGYAVSAPPEGGAPPAPSAPPYGASPPPAQPENIFIYPKNGQSADQQAFDRYECHRWAADQTGFDPTRSASVPAEAANEKRADYLRAQQACLEARGYTVR